MKFKNQIFALGTIAIIAAPIATVVSCGAKPTTPIITIIPTPAKKTVRVERASAQGYYIDLNSTFHIYSSTLPRADETFTFLNVASNKTIVFTAKAPTHANTRIELVQTTDGKDPKTLTSLHLNPADTTSLIFSDKSGSYYIADPVKDALTILNWVNFNKIVTGTDPKAGAQMVTTSLKDTGYHCVVITISTPDNVVTMTLAKD